MDGSGYGGEGGLCPKTLPTTLLKLIFISDVNHAMDCRTAWVPTPGTAGHCAMRALYFKSSFYYDKTMLGKAANVTLVHKEIWQECMCVQDVCTKAERGGGL